MSLEIAKRAAAGGSSSPARAGHTGCAQGAGVMEVARGHAGLRTAGRMASLDPRVTVEHDVPCRMRDGVTLVADVYRPADDHSYPVILMRTPYDKTIAQTDIYAHPTWYARRGYVVVVQDCRGRGKSEGEWYYDRDEAADGFDTVEWAGRLPGAVPRVGMYGASYVGYTQLLAATQQPRSLRAIAPAVTYGRMYDVIYQGGALCLGIVLQAAIVHGYLVAGRSRDAKPERYEELVHAMYGVMDHYSALPLRDLPFFEGGHAPWYKDWLDHPCYDDFWRRIEVAQQYARITVPAMHVSGWYDICIGTTIDNFLGLQRAAGTESARRQQKLIVGPWKHMPWTALAGAPADTANGRVVDGWQLEWFAHHLKEQHGRITENPVTAFVVGDGWRDFSAWPTETDDHTSWFLHSDGRANTREGDGVLTREPPHDEPPDLYVYDPAFPNHAVGGHSCCWPGAPMGPAEQSEAQEAASVLTYTSAPLEEDVDVIGSLRVELYAASSACDTDFVARACVVDPCGYTQNLQEGIVRARFRDSVEKPQLIEAGTTYRYEIDLGPVGVRLKAGQRLRVAVASADFPQWDRNLNTGGIPADGRLLDAVVATQAVFHDSDRSSRLLLPWAPVGDGGIAD